MTLDPQNLSYLSASASAVLLVWTRLLADNKELVSADHVEVKKDQPPFTYPVYCNLVLIGHG